MQTETRYNLNDVPKIKDLTAISIQWLLVVAPILIIGGRIVAELHYTDLAEKTMYIQKIFFVSGLTLLLQLLIGHKLPIVSGPSAVLIVGIYATLNSTFEAIYTSIAICGIFLFAIAFTGKLNILNKFFTENVVTAILILIAFTLTPIILELLLSDENAAFNVFFAITLVLSVFWASRKFKGLWNFMILLSLTFGSLAYFFVFPQKLETKIPSFEPIFFSKLNFFFSFQAEALLIFFLCYLALAVNDISSIYTTGKIINAGEFESRIKRGVSITGFSNFLSGILGVIGSVNYTLSPGIIHATKSYSRFALIPTGIALIFLSLLPSVIFVFNFIPKAVIASVFLIILCSQIAVALEKAKIDSEESGFVIGFPVLVSVVISFIPPEAFEGTHHAVKAFLGNGFLIGILSAILLEHVIFKKSYSKSQKR